MAPFKAKPRQPGIEEALAEVQRRHGSVEMARELAQDSASRRAQAIRHALELGASLRQVADLIHVTPEAVRKMSRES